MNSLIPITKIDISKEHWLNTSIKYETNFTIDNILCKLAYETYSLMNNLEDYNIIIDYNSFIDSFINMIYTTYLLKKPIIYPYELDDNYDFYDLKYSERINNLFLYFVTLSNIYSLGLFNKLNDNYMDLLDFIYNNIELIDLETINEENTFNDEENYSMSILSKC